MTFEDFLPVLIVTVLTAISWVISALLNLYLNFKGWRYANKVRRESREKTRQEAIENPELGLACTVCGSFFDKNGKCPEGH